MENHGKSPLFIGKVMENHGEITIDHYFHDLFFLSYIFFLNSELLDNQRVTGCYAKR